MILKDDQVHICSAFLPVHNEDIVHFASMLSKDECERASKFRFARDQHRFIVARGIFRILLSQYLKCKPKDIEIVYGLWGKPALLEENQLRFNISHSGEYALYALTRHYEIGIDLEYINEDLELESMALSLFSSQKATYWDTLSSEEKVKFFFKYWVCKEASLKASGKGLLSDEWKNSSSMEKTMEYSHYFECIPDYASALFIDGPPLQPVYYKWNQSRV